MWHEHLKRGNRNRFVSTFLPKHVKQHCGARPAIRMAIEVHDIVQVTWSRPFSERTQFFAERFFVGIAICPYASFWAVAIRMKDFAPDRWEDQPLVSCQVELDFRPTPEVGDTGPRYAILPWQLGCPRGLS